jgi:hypothetical protein
VLVRLQILFVVEHRRLVLILRRLHGLLIGYRRRRGLGTILFRDLEQRQRVGVDHAHDALVSQLAAKQAHRFHVGVDVFIGARDEAGDEDALERRDVQLGRDGRLDRDLGVTRTRRESGQQRQAGQHCVRPANGRAPTDRLSEPRDH